MNVIITGLLEVTSYVRIFFICNCLLYSRVLGFENFSNSCLCLHFLVFSFDIKMLNVINYWVLYDIIVFFFFVLFFFQVRAKSFLNGQKFFKWPGSRSLFIFIVEACLDCQGLKKPYSLYSGKKMRNLSNDFLTICLRVKVYNKIFCCLHSDNSLM